MPPPPIEPTRPRFRGRGFLVGCLISIAAVVVVVVIALAALNAWLRTPGPLLEPGRLLDADTVVYGEIRLRAEDPGVRDLVRSALGVRDAQRERVAQSKAPDALKWIFGAIPQRQPSERDIDKILPVIVALTRQKDLSGATGPYLFAVSFPRAANTMRMIDATSSFVLGWGRSDVKRETHGDEILYLLPGKGAPTWASIVGSDVLLSRDEAAMKSGVDRLAARPAGDAAATPLAIREERPPGSAVFMAAAPGHGDAVVDLLQIAVPPVAVALRPLVKDAGAVTLWGRLASADLLEGELHIEQGEGGGSQDEYSGTITAPLSEGDVTFEMEPIPKGPAESHAFRISVKGIGAALREGIIRLDERDRRGRGRSEPESPGEPETRPGDDAPPGSEGQSGEETTPEPEAKPASPAPAAPQ